MLPNLSPPFTENKIARRVLLIGVAGVFASSITLPTYAAERMVVIVHPKNQERLSRAELAAIFTTRKQSWGSGKRIVPFNFPARHPIRASFDQSVLGMNPEEVARYWIDRRIRGGNAPPKQVNNAQLIVRLVAKLEGAIGYVPKSLANGSVRIVKEI